MGTGYWVLGTGLLDTGLLDTNYQDIGREAPSSRIRAKRQHQREALSSATLCVAHLASDIHTS